MEREVKINARGLSAPGPRMMVETALAKAPCKVMRVVVSNSQALEDLREFFASRRATVKIDQVGEEYHLVASFED
jgi:TusA-related sulfurtransferase